MNPWTWPSLLSPHTHTQTHTNTHTHTHTHTCTHMHTQITSLMERKKRLQDFFVTNRIKEASWFACCTVKLKCACTFIGLVTVTSMYKIKWWPRSMCDDPVRLWRELFTCLQRAQNVADAEPSRRAVPGRQLPWRRPRSCVFVCQCSGCSAKWVYDCFCIHCICRWCVYFKIIVYCGSVDNCTI